MNWNTRSFSVFGVFSSYGCNPSLSQYVKWEASPRFLLQSSICLRRHHVTFTEGASSETKGELPLISYLLSIHFLHVHSELAIVYLWSNYCQKSLKDWEKQLCIWLCPYNLQLLWCKKKTFYFYLPPCLWPALTTMDKKIIYKWAVHSGLQVTQMPYFMPLLIRVHFAIFFTISTKIV